MKLSIFAAIILSLCSIITTGAVIGIDFGNNFFKISLISPGKSLLIVENTTTKRKTNTAVAFLEKEKVYETDAALKKLRNPANSFVFIQKFIGITKSDREPFEIAKKYFDEYNYVFDPERETVQFEIKNFAALDDGQTSIILSVEQIAAIILKYGKYLSEKFGKVDIKDCVVTIPPHWNIKQRFQLIQSIELAGLHPLALVSENTAAALYYAIDRYDENSTYTALIYNVGSYNLQVSLVQYHTVNNTQKSNKKLTETLKVLADYSESDLGSLNFDLILANIFIEEIDAKPNRKGKPSIRENRKAMLKLLKECNRIKEVLSANKDSSIYIEGLVDGQDFKSQITRQQFEDKSNSLIEKMIAPIDIVLKKAGLTLENIDAVEIIGGGVRIPKLQQVLNQKVGKDLGAHLNGDEAMALGASFMAANYSHSFKVRDIWLDDGFNFEILMKISNLNESEVEKFNKNLTLYPFKKRFGTKKQISFTYEKDLQLEMIIKHENGNQELFALYNITNISNLSNHEWYKEFGKPKIYLDFELNSLDVILFENAEIRVNRTEQYETLEEEKKPKRITPIVNETNTTDSTNNGTTGETADSNQQQPQTESGEAENKEQKPEDTSSNSENANSTDSQTSEESTSKQESDSSTQEQKESTQENQEKSAQTTENNSTNQTDEVKQEEVAKQKQKPKKVKKIRKRTNLISIPIEVKEYLNVIPPLNDTEFKRQANFIKKLDENEQMLKKTAEAKNKLESSIYSIRDLMAEESFMKASTEEERTNLTKLTLETDDWLQSDEGFRSKMEVYNDRFNNMSVKVKPIIKRLEEYRKRPEAVNKTMQKIEEYIKKVEKLNVTMPWIKPKDKAPLYNLINKTVTWLGQMIEEQEKKPLYEDPVFLVDDILPKMDQIRRSFVALKNTKKPPKKTKLNTTLDQNGTTNGTSNFTNANKTGDGEQANINIEDLQTEEPQATEETKEPTQEQSQQSEKQEQTNNDKKPQENTSDDGGDTIDKEESDEQKKDKDVSDL